jgi:hypothetical protein
VRRASVITVWLVRAVLFASLAHAQQSTVYGYDLNGNPVAQLAAPAAPAIVILFLATDCPISNRYIPEIQRLETEFSARHVVFWLVYPNATETIDGIRRHQAAYGIQGETLMRPRPQLMALIHPSVTPESAVLVPQSSGGEDLKALYIGRIDNRFVDFGRERPQATRHDLEQALEAVLNHQAVAPPGGPPVGCGIISEAALQSGAAKP